MSIVWFRHDHEVGWHLVICRLVRDFSLNDSW